MGGQNRDAMGPGFGLGSVRSVIERMAVHVELEEALGTGGKEIRVMHV